MNYTIYTHIIFPQFFRSDSYDFIVIIQCVRPFPFIHSALHSDFYFSLQPDEQIPIFFYCNIVSYDYYFRKTKLLNNYLVYMFNNFNKICEGSQHLSSSWIVFFFCLPTIVLAFPCKSLFIIEIAICNKITLEQLF